MSEFPKCPSLGLHAAVAGNHNHPGIGLMPVNFLQKTQAILVGFIGFNQPDVEKRKVQIFLPLEYFPCFLQCGCRHDIVAFALQHPA